MLFRFKYGPYVGLTVNPLHPVLGTTEDCRKYIEALLTPHFEAIILSRG